MNVSVGFLIKCGLENCRWLVVQTIQGLKLPLNPQNSLKQDKATNDIQKRNIASCEATGPENSYFHLVPPKYRSHAE
jgi:hypothetical protein